MHETEEELLVYTNAQISFQIDDSEIPNDMISSLINLVESGVSIKVILGGISHMNELKSFLSKPRDHPNLAQIPIRYAPAVSNTFDVIDGEKVLLQISNPINPSEYFAAIHV